MKNLVAQGHQFAMHFMPESKLTGAVDDSPREKLLRATKIQRVHWLIVGLSILLTLSAWYISSAQVAKTNQVLFKNEVTRVINQVRERMRLYENALSSAKSLIDSNGGEVDYPMWLRYANSANIDQTYPGINGIGVIFHVKPENLERFLVKERDWQPQFSIRPQHSQSEFWPITYIEPEYANRQAIGLDVAFESNRYEGIERARLTGKAQITGPITLVQDSKKTPGFLLYVPFYKRGGSPATDQERYDNIVGVTYAPFIMDKLMQGTLASANRYVSISITDDSELLYEDSGDITHSSVDIAPDFTEQVKVDLYGREWVFEIATNLNFRDATTNNQPLFILFGGIAIDLMLLMLFVFLSTANRKALGYADQITEDLNLNAERLLKSNNDLERFAYIASHDLKSPLNAINKLAGWVEEDIGDDIPDASKKHLALLRGRSERMSCLLEDLLNYSKIGRFQYQVEKIRLEELVNNNILLIDSSEQFSIKVEDFELHIPRVPFELVLRNVISNAVKHHHRDNGVINVSCELLDDNYHLSIRDDGPGIPPELQVKVMEMFQTLQSRDKVEGSGMGLATSKKIVEHYGGSIGIDSNGKDGTTVLIVWPKQENI